MLGLKFKDYEQEVRSHLSGMFSKNLFDFDRDVATISVNRWAHGYTIGGPGDSTRIGRQPFGRIARNPQRRCHGGRGAIGWASHFVGQRVGHVQYGCAARQVTDLGQPARERMPGVDPLVHGILTSNVRVDGELRPAQEVGPAAPTLFDHCRAAGLRSAGVFGDQNLVGVCGARAADAHWPPEGVLPEQAARGAFGFGADRAVLDALGTFDLDALDLLVLQLDEVDTARHRFGPDAPEVLEQCRATDAVFGAVLEQLRPRWHETIVIAVSDHDHEAVREGAVDLALEATARGLDLLVDHDGTSTVLYGSAERSVLLELPGVSDARALAPDCTLVWGEPGQAFGADWGLKAQHGSPRTTTQMAIVGGGHPAAKALGERIARTPPPATLWADLVRELLPGV